MDKWEEKRNKLNAMLEKRAKEGVTREEAAAIHELQKQLWAHSKIDGTFPSRCLSRRMFGKRLCDMTPEEKRQYEAERYKIKTEHRIPWGESIVRKTFGKPVKELTKEERTEYLKIIGIYHPVLSPHGGSLVRQMFGKPIKDLTDIEKKQYYMALKERAASK